MKLPDKLDTIANVAVLVGLGIFLFGPDGIVYEKWTEWRRSVEEERRVDRHWEALTRLGARLDDGSSRVAVVEFADYQCPYCARAHRTLERWLSRNDVGVAYRHLPLDIHPRAEGAARASICAQEQGRFKAMHRRLFSSSQWEEDGDWRRVAREAGVPDLERFARCLQSDRATERLRRDSALAGKLGIEGTLTFVHEGGIVSGSPSAETLAEFTASN